MGLIGKKRFRELLGGCSDGTIYRLEKKGMLPPKRNLPGGRTALWDEEESLACIKILAQVSAAPATRVDIGKGKAGPGRPRKKPEATA